MSQTYSLELKEQVVKEVQDTHNATLVARQHQLSPSMVRRWTREARQRTADSPEGLSLAEGNATIEAVSD
jgi:transposase-like protein